MKKISFILVHKITQSSVQRFQFSPIHPRKHLPILSSLLLIITCLLSCATVQVYKEPDQPVFQSIAKKPQSARQANSLNVVTFNIKKAKKTQLAATELQRFEETRNIDVYLLQEMD